jgi:antagonist of KipI
MLEVIEAGGLVTLQDAGRRGWRRFGVPSSGPMDALACEAAQLLAGNSPQTAVLEIGGGDVSLRATQDCVIAVTGAGYKLGVNTWEYPLWGAYFVRSGWTIRLERSGFGMWAYLALAGGIEARSVLGSRSTYLRGRLGGMDGRALQAGDVMRGAEPSHELMERAGRAINEEARPSYGEAPTVEVIPGPQGESFAPEALRTLLSSTYRVGLSSDRMGYRLEGPRLATRGKTDLTSEGMSVGCIQVAGDGAPIAMMADCATTGGYPKIACIVRADLPLLAQCTAGRDDVRFRETTVAAAQEKFRRAIQRLRHGMVQPEDG